MVYASSILATQLNNKNMNNIYDKKFELYLVKKGYNLDQISLQECLKEMKLWKKNTVDAQRTYQQEVDFA